MTLPTAVRPVDRSIIQDRTADDQGAFLHDDWTFSLSEDSPEASSLHDAATRLKTSDIPVAFPTETVYGLGADATRSSAVKGIFQAKQRPLDNPLIVHVHSLNQLRDILVPGSMQAHSNDKSRQNGHTLSSLSDLVDPIPEIYKPLISKFWPGPLTILLQNPPGSILAPEVTAGLPTFGARLPNSLLALVLIKMAGVPIAAPSANASTKPSPTAAEHVLHDLNGRIEVILDGGPCDVGVESTVVDGLSSPPSILRPGGISIDQIRQCPGWEDITVGYKDATEAGSKPRAPGMKYRHYSPKAKVVLYEAGNTQPSIETIQEYTVPNANIGVIRTSTWKPFSPNTTKERGSRSSDAKTFDHSEEKVTAHESVHTNGSQKSFTSTNAQHSRSFFPPRPAPARTEITSSGMSSVLSHIWDIDLGQDSTTIARGLFSALRALDVKDVSVIVVEGIKDTGDVAAAVMNRLRKAAGTIVGQ